MFRFFSFYVSNNSSLLNCARRSSLRLRDGLMLRDDPQDLSVSVLSFFFLRFRFLFSLTREAWPFLDGLPAGRVLAFCLGLQLTTLSTWGQPWCTNKTIENVLRQIGCAQFWFRQHDDGPSDSFVAGGDDDDDADAPELIPLSWNRIESSATSSAQISVKRSFGTVRNTWWSDLSLSGNSSNPFRTSHAHRVTTQFCSILV